MIRLLVPFHVAGELRLPPCGVGLRVRCVLGTTVPEAAVDEHGHTSGREHDVGPTPESANRPTVDVIPQPERMESPPDQHLRRRVARGLSTHPPTYAGARWFGPLHPNTISPFRAGAIPVLQGSTFRQDLQEIGLTGSKYIGDGRADAEFTLFVCEKSLKEGTGRPNQSA